jgi:alkylhydroperoxidase family enzyme
LLRASSEANRQEYDLRLLLGQGEGDGGVPHGRLLVHFAEAVLSDDDRLLSEKRAAVLARLGSEALIDAAGVIGLFNAIDRVADATGIPLEEEKARLSASYRAELGLDEFTRERA